MGSLGVGGAARVFLRRRAAVQGLWRLAKLSWASPGDGVRLETSWDAHDSNMVPGHRILWMLLRCSLHKLQASTSARAQSCPRGD